eukprot:XP_027317692.1 uncharacterized protein LOC113844160 [Anas platyrhynchos]
MRRAGCAHHPDGKQQLSEGCSPCTHTPRGSWCPPASGRLRNNSILTQVPVLWAHLAPFGHRGRPPQMRLLPKCASIAPSPNAPWCWRLPMLRGARAGACLHPEHLREPPALSRGTQAPTRQPHGTHRGTSCAPGGTPRGATCPHFLGAQGSTRSRPSSVQGSRVPALPCPQAASSLPLSPERIRAQSRMGPKNSSTSSGWDLALQQVLKPKARRQQDNDKIPTSIWRWLAPLRVPLPHRGTQDTVFPLGWLSSTNPAPPALPTKSLCFLPTLCFPSPPLSAQVPALPTRTCSLPSPAPGTKPEVKPTHASSGSNTPKKRLFAPNCL